MSPPSGKATQAQANDAGAPAELTESQKLNQVRATVQARIAQLTAQDAALDKQISTARSKALPALRQQDEQLEGQLELQKAMLEGLSKISTMADTQTGHGLLGDIERLQRTAPQLAAVGAKVNPPSVLDSLNNALDAGVSSQAIVLFQLLSARHTVDDSIQETDDLRRQANDMRTPLIKLLRATVQQGDQGHAGRARSHGDRCRHARGNTQAVRHPDQYLPRAVSR